MASDSEDDDAAWDVDAAEAGGGGTVDVILDTAQEVTKSIVHECFQFSTKVVNGTASYILSVPMPGYRKALKQRVLRGGDALGSAPPTPLLVVPLRPPASPNLPSF